MSNNILNDCIYSILIKNEIEKIEILEYIASCDNAIEIFKIIYETLCIELCNFKKIIEKKHKNNKLTVKKFYKFYNKLYYKYIKLNKKLNVIFDNSKKNTVKKMFYKNYYDKVNSKVIYDIIKNTNNKFKKNAIINIIKIHNKINKFSSKKIFEYDIHKNIIDEILIHIQKLINTLYTNTDKLKKIEKKKIVNKLQYLCYICINQTNNKYFIKMYTEKLIERLISLKYNSKLESSLLQINGFSNSNSRNEYINMVMIINDFISSDFFNDLFVNPQQISAIINIVPKINYSNNGIDEKLINYKNTKIYQLNYHSFEYLEKMHYIELIKMPLEIDYCINGALKFSCLDWDNNNISMRHNYHYRRQKIIYEISNIELCISLFTGDYEIMMTLLQASIYIYINKSGGEMKWSDIVNIMNVDENVIFPHMLSLALIGIIKKCGEILKINTKWSYVNKTGINIIQFVEKAKQLIKEKIEIDEKIKNNERIKRENTCMEIILKIFNDDFNNKSFNLQEIINIIEDKNIDGISGEKLVTDSMKLLIKNKIVISIVKENNVYFKISEVSSSDSDSD